MPPIPQASTEPRPAPRTTLKRHTHVLRGRKQPVRWVRFSSQRVDPLAPSMRLLSQHDPLLGLAMVAPFETVLAAMAADTATIRVIR